MKKYMSLLLLLPALLALCACAQGTGPNSPTANASLSLTLPAAEQPKLDFAVGTDGLVDLLGQDGQILSYRADGTLAEQYDLALTQQGLTACRIAAGDGVLYLLDGHNNAILTVEQGAVKTVSALGFSDVGLVKSLYVDRDGVLWLSFADVEKEAYTAAIDPSGAEAKIVGETQPGYLLGPGLTYLPEIVSDEDGTNQVRVTLYQAGQTLDSFCLRASDSHRSPFGLRLYGLADDDRDGKAKYAGKYAGILYEFVNETDDPDQEQLLQTPVLIDPESGTVEAAETSLNDEDVVEPTADETYGMTFSNEALMIQPIGAYFSGQGTSADYVLTR